MTDNVSLLFEEADDSLCKTLSWDHANLYCLFLGDGWRLPTINELRLMKAKHYPDIETAFALAYWSGDEFSVDRVWARYMFNDSIKVLTDMKKVEYYVKPVRDRVNKGK